ncbi:hypothetical protein [Chromobacterium subtsugae]|uniref:hypothetical protein n=1 Tax=Chromobacterium subtsugae TaxID=251747 RepID=UPI000ACE5B74|nr:hypothetical protein [Chromobacterium subtsugae]
MRANTMPCAVVGSLWSHLLVQDRAERLADHLKDKAVEFQVAYTNGGIDWEDVAGSTEATLAMNAQLLDLVHKMPDCPARRLTVEMLEAARSDYVARKLREYQREAA